MTLQCRATIHAEHLRVKQGLRTFEAEVPQLRYLYVQQAGGGVHVNLLLAVARPSGKNKILRLYANPGDPGFLAFVEAIVAHRPDIDLRGLEESVALKKMGAANMDLIGLVIMVLVIPAIVGGFLLPKLVHGLDFGQDRIALATIEQGTGPDSRNVVITNAQARLDQSIEQTTTTTKGGVETGATTKYYLPLVPPDWNGDTSVHVILKTDPLTTPEEHKLEHGTSFPGVVRDVLWEGLDDGKREFFTKEVGLKLADGVKLVEYRADPRTDLLVFLGATGTTFLIMFAVGVGMWWRKRRK